MKDPPAWPISGSFPIWTASPWQQKNPCCHGEKTWPGETRLPPSDWDEGVRRRWAADHAQCDAFNSLEVHGKSGTCPHQTTNVSLGVVTYRIFPFPICHLRPPLRQPPPPPKKHAIELGGAHLLVQCDQQRYFVKVWNGFICKYIKMRLISEAACPRLVLAKAQTRANKSAQPISEIRDQN